MSSARLRSAGRVLLLLGFVVFGVFYMMIAMGGASFVNECTNVICAQLQQAIFAAVAGVALFVAAHRLSRGESSAWLVAFLGTLPILIVHVILVMEDPSESVFFPLSSVPAPLLAGSVLVGDRKRTKS